VRVPGTPPPPRRATRPWHVAISLYAAVLAVYVVVVGLPLDRGLQAVWILAGMAAWQVGRPLRSWGRMLADWIPFIAALVVYDQTRGVADTLGRPVLVGGLAEAERVVSGGQIPTLVLQEHFFDPFAVHWYDALAALVYFSHFMVPWALAAVLYLRSRDAWLGYARRIFTLTYLGLLTYVLLPAAPPWFAAEQGLIGEVQRAATRGWSVLGLRSAGQLLEAGQAGVNLVAALPSLHAGTSMLVTLWGWSAVRSAWARAGLVLYSVAMGVTLVYGGEHYVLDVLAGWAYAAAVVAFWVWWERRRAPLRRSPSRAEPLAAAGTASREESLRRPASSHRGSACDPAGRAGSGPC
jgi:membrane-associated phospholipid phosphatase